MKLRLAIALTPMLLSMACGEIMEVTPEESVTSLPGYQTRVFALEAPCMVNVEGIGMVDIENDYIPGVVACENGGAPLEALKAQAVQARGFLYYKLFVAGVTTIRNSTADQVYRCSYRPNGPDEIHRKAARETKGQYVTWDNKIVAPFYVAGAIPPNPNVADPITSCQGVGGNDPTSTERWVTYNFGKAGCGIKMTPLGWVPDDCTRNPHNRGCASQNGEACLARLGWKYQDMLDYYYGSDIALTNATGSCGGPAPQVLTDYDRFCGLKDDGSYCFDAGVRVQCAAAFEGASEVCAGECVEGACVGGVEPTDQTCTALADGSHCIDNATRVECAGGELGLTETCTSGCTDGACASPASNNPNPNTPTPVDPTPVDPTNPGTNTDKSFPTLVSPSSGTVQSCSTTPGGALSPMLLVMVGWMLRRRRG